MRWIMTLGERPNPAVPSYAEDPGPDKARAVALVHDFSLLFPILKKWCDVFGDNITGWAVPTGAEDLDNLPSELLTQWEEEGAELRMDVLPGGYIKVSDYRPLSALADLAVNARQSIRR